MTKPEAEEIARRAYEIYQRRGAGHGRDQDDWYQAEQELRATNPGSTRQGTSAGAGREPAPAGHAEQGASEEAKARRASAAGRPNRAKPARK